MTSRNPNGSRKREVEIEPTTSRRVSSRGSAPNEENDDRSSRRRSAESSSEPRVGSSNERITEGEHEIGNNNEEDTKKYNFQKFKFSTKAKDLERFQNIPSEAQAQCIKAISRLFIFKGTDVTA